MAKATAGTALSETVDDYLQTIYSLETEGETVISARLARWMQVTPPTAWATVKRMQRDGLVRLDDKKHIHLTPQGHQLAENIARRHRLSERFLTDILKLRWADVHEEAHHFEHGLTPVIEQGIFELLGKPKTCPHGSPIPRTGAKLSPLLVPIDTLEPGSKATVHFISEELEQDKELLEYLERHHLKPGRTITILERVPSSGVIVIESEGESVSLGLSVAAKIRVKPSAR